MKKKQIALGLIRKHYPQVERVVDAKKGIYLTVTKNDGAGASRKDPNDCALARACKRQLKADGAIINISTSYVIKGTTAIRYHTAGTVAREITSFDRGAGFEEGHNYRLSPIPPHRRLGTDHGPNPATRSKRDGSRTGRHLHKTENVRIADRTP